MSFDKQAKATIVIAVTVLGALVGVALAAPDSPGGTNTPVPAPNFTVHPDGQPPSDSLPQQAAPKDPTLPLPPGQRELTPAEVRAGNPPNQPDKGVGRGYVVEEDPSKIERGVDCPHEVDPSSCAK